MNIPTSVLSFVDEPYRSSLSGCFLDDFLLDVSKIINKVDSDPVVQEVLNGPCESISDKITFAYFQCLGLAIEAAMSGNYGIGAVVVNSGYNVVVTGKNRVFENNYPLAFQAHAEMDALQNLFTTYPQIDTSKLKVLSSLEPCPMCTIGIMNSGIESVHIGSLDELGGWPITNHNLMLPVFKEISVSTCYEKANIPEVLAIALSDIFFLTKYQLDKELS